MRDYHRRREPTSSRMSKSACGQITKNCFSLKYSLRKYSSSASIQHLNEGIYKPCGIGNNRRAALISVNIDPAAAAQTTNPHQPAEGRKELNSSHASGSPISPPRRIGASGCPTPPRASGPPAPAPRTPDPLPRVSVPRPAPLTPPPPARAPPRDSGKSAPELRAR